MSWLGSAVPVVATGVSNAKLQINTIKGLAFSASALALVSGSQAFAQDADCPEGTDEVDGECVVQSDGPDGVDNNDANTGDVFNHEKYPRAFIGMLLEQAPESCEPLHRAGG